VAVLAAELESVLLVHTNGVGGVVHQGAVSDLHHVLAQAGVDGGAKMLVADVTTVVIAVTLPGGVNTLAVVALELVHLAHTLCLVTLVLAIIITIALPAFVDAARSIGALELVGTAAGLAVLLVPSVSAVIISVAQPRLLDTQEVVALHLANGARHFVAVDFIGVITTVVITITLKLGGDALAVVALQLVFTGAVAGAVDFI